MALYAFDGTWNEKRDAGEYDKNTNVVLMVDAYTGSKSLYRGVGTRYGKLGKFFGGAFGVGGKKRIREGFDDLYKNFYSGDTHIDIIGFSRGAAMALHFANMVRKKGVRNPDSGEVLVRRPPIRFLGLWDVVASFGIPINIGIPFNRINLGYRLKMSKNVQYCFHALALDEKRQTFRPTRVPAGHEVWFRGVHSDVGGGNENLGLNAIALHWMLQKAVAIGVSIDPGALEKSRQMRDTAAGIFENKDMIENKCRELSATARVHYSVSPEPGLQNPQAGTPVETEVMEQQAQPVNPA